MWQAFAIVLCMALVNALRRTLFNMARDPRGTVGDLLEITLLGLLVGGIIVATVGATLRRHPTSGREQYIAVAFATLASSALGVFLKDAWEVDFSSDASTLATEYGLALYFLSDWLRYGVPAALLVGAYLYLRAETQNAASTDRIALESAEMARRLAETRLRVLEAQIEPHFLFNTLASVKRLLRSDPQAADRMLEDLMRYLSVALPRVREAEATLGGEAELVRAFLDIHAIRMGERMQVKLSVPPELHDARVPPFMVLTLVENAVKHGVAPSPNGGAVDVSARASDGKLIVEVRDTGRGFVVGSGDGTGLANIRTRLELVYGQNASLALSHNVPTGVIATLALPLEYAQVPQAA